MWHTHLKHEAWAATTWFRRDSFFFFLHKRFHSYFSYVLETCLIEIVCEQIVCTFSTSVLPPTRPPAPWRRRSSELYILRRAVPRRDRWRQLDGADASVRTRPTTERKYAKRIYIRLSTNWSFLPLRSMDTGCFTAAQRISCHTMNADLFKPVPERGPQQSSASMKTSRNKHEQTKPELAQVVTDSKTGRSYSKGKLLGKVCFHFYLWSLFVLCRGDEWM